MHRDPVRYPSDRTTPEVRTGLQPENIHLLSDLPGRLSTELFASAKPVRLAAGKVLYLAGDSGDDCYRIEDGLLKVTMVSHSGDERILAFVGRGDIVGELSIIDGLPRSASVVAVRDATLSCLSRIALKAKELSEITYHLSALRVGQPRAGTHVTNRTHLAIAS